MLSQPSDTNSQYCNRLHLVQNPYNVLQHKKTECSLTRNDTHQNVGGNWKQILCWGVVAVLMLYSVIEKVTQNGM